MIRDESNLKIKIKTNKQTNKQKTQTTKRRFKACQLKDRRRLFCSYSF